MLDGLVPESDRALVDGVELLELELLLLVIVDRVLKSRGRSERISFNAIVVQFLNPDLRCSLAS
jgi:hypothetical protein